MAKKTILVNRHVLASNKKHSQSEPPLSCKVRGTTIYGHEVVLLSDEGKEIAKLVYAPERPRDCGATVWLETHCNLKVIVRKENSTEET